MQKKKKETQSSSVPFLLGFHPVLFFPGAFPLRRKALKCSLVILAREVTLSICGLCQWHLSWIWRELGERGQGDSMDTTLKDKKWGSSRVSLKIVSDWCECCQRWWRSRHLLPCMTIMTATQGRNPISLHASQESPMALAVLMADESCQLCSFLQQLCRKTSLAPSLWWHNGEKMEKTSKMWACHGLQPSQNDSEKTNNLPGISLEASKVHHQPVITFLRFLQVATASHHWATWLCSCSWARQAFRLCWCGCSCMNSSCQLSPLVSS